MAQAIREVRWSEFVPRWIEATFLSLLGVILVVFLGLIWAKPTYEIPLRDGAFYVFATVTAFSAKSRLHRDLSSAAPIPNWVRDLSLRFGAILGVAGAIVYTAIVAAKFGGPALGPGREPWLSLGIALTAIVYSLVCLALGQYSPSTQRERVNHQ